MNKLNLTTFQEVLENFRVKPNDNYLCTYPYFVNYFAAKKGVGLSYEDLIIGTHFVYGWMPTIPNFNHQLAKDEKKKAAVLTAINAVLHGDELSEGNIKLLMKFINNSLVGTSKLLHFINPEVYPIWDSHIARFIFFSNDPRKNISQNFLKNIQNYLDYKDTVYKIIQTNEFKTYFQTVNQVLLQNNLAEVSRVRAVEMVIFNQRRKK